MHDRHHRDREAHQVLRLPPRHRRRRPRGQRRRGVRLPRPQRRRQDDDDPDPPRPHPADLRPGAASSASRRPSTRSPSTAGSATCRASSRSTTSSPAARRSSTSRTSAAASTRRTRQTSIARLDLDPSRKFKEYSKGNKQKVGLVIALQHRPDLLILDEPTSGLDPLVQQTFYEVIREAKAEGRTVFLSSHILSARSSRPAIASRSSATGRLVKVDRVEALRDLAHHQVELRFAGDVPVGAFAALPGVSDVVAEDQTSSGCACPGSITPVVREAAPATTCSTSSAASRRSRRRSWRSTAAATARRPDMTVRRRARPATVAPATTRLAALAASSALGSVFGKTMRDSRRAILAVAILLGAAPRRGELAIVHRVRHAGRRARSWPTSSRAVPPILAGPRRQGRSTSRRSAATSSTSTATFFPIIVSLWSILALSGTLAAEARRGSLEFVAAAPIVPPPASRSRSCSATSTGAGHRRAGRRSLALPIVGRSVNGAARRRDLGRDGGRATRSGSACSRSPPARLAFALAPFLGRGSAAGVAGAVMFGGFILNGYQAAIPDARAAGRT